MVAPTVRTDHSCKESIGQYSTVPADETLADCGARVVAVARDAVASVAEGQIVIVGHQDPIHAAHIALTGQMPAPYHSTKPNHGAVITLEPRPGPWHRTASWEPEQGSRFPSFE